jgi:hypothetical protein
VDDSGLTVGEVFEGLVDDVDRLVERVDREEAGGAEEGVGFDDGADRGLIEAADAGCGGGDTWSQLQLEGVLAEELLLPEAPLTVAQGRTTG